MGNIKIVYISYSISPNKFDFIYSEYGCNIYICYIVLIWTHIQKFEAIKNSRNIDKNLIFTLYFMWRNCIIIIIKIYTNKKIIRKISPHWEWILDKLVLDTNGIKFPMPIQVILE